MNDNSEGVYYLANLQVKTLALYKPESYLANTFTDFPETITFMFSKFWNSYFQG